MALPSSPSLLPDQIPSSPPLPPLPSYLSEPASRKRPFFEYLYDSQSSDPVFSDATTDAEQLPSDRDPRRKKQFVRGAWFQLGREEAQSAKLAKRKNPLRNTDSGVWMGSDEDVVSSDVHLPSPPTVPIITQTSVNAEIRNKDISTLSQPEVHAARRIRRLIDDGSEIFDLSGLALDNLSNTTLEPLRHLVRSSHANHHTLPPSEDEFAPLVPSIQLFLSCNSLVEIPHYIFNLDNLTVLSLRNNLLKSIPFAIGRLGRLRELNISGNLIEYLPYDLLELLSPSAQRTMVLRPNPLYVPECVDSNAVDVPLIDDLVWEECARWFSWEVIGNPYGALKTLRGILKKHGIDPLQIWVEMELRLFLGRRQRALASDKWAGARLEPSRDNGRPDALYYWYWRRLFGNRYAQEPRVSVRPPGDDDSEEESDDEDEHQEAEEEEVVEEEEEPVEDDEEANMLQLIYLASTKMRFFEVDGRSYDSETDHSPDLTLFVDSSPPQATAGTGASSLFEMALQKMQRGWDLGDTVVMLSSSGLTSLNYAVEQAAVNLERGYNTTCSVCGKPCILPRAEWVEFWFYGPASQKELTKDTVLPFLRNACSWSCAKPSTVGTYKL